MNSKKVKNEYSVLPFESDPADALIFEAEGVTEADVLAADRLIKTVADELDSRVDYAGMLRNIKAEAMREGLAAAANSGRAKKARTKRILSIAASVAAAFVVGLGVLGVVKAIGGAEHGSGSVKDDGNISAAVDSVSATESNDIPEATRFAEPTAYPDAQVTNALPTAYTILTPDSSSTIDFTPLPTETAIKGGIRGYTYITGFTSPEKSEELFDELLPEGMEAEPTCDGLGFYAIDTGDSARTITCRVVEATDTDFEVGVAMYTINVLGRVEFVWRIDEDSLMYIEFEGFDYSEAEEFLFSYSEREAAVLPAA